MHIFILPDILNSSRVLLLNGALRKGLERNYRVKITFVSVEGTENGVLALYSFAF